MIGVDTMKLVDDRPQTATVRQFEALVAFLESIDDLGQWQSRTPAERGQAFVDLCDEAADIEQSKRKLGLPILPPESWPQSTWELLRRHAANA